MTTAAPPLADRDAERPDAIEDPSNRWLVHPLGAALVGPAMRAGVHPNTVSIAGLVCGALAGFAYSQWRDPAFATLGFVLMIGWHVCDGLDGKLARATGRVTPFGRLLDGLCDYLVFFFVLIPIALGLPDRPAMLALCLTAGAAHALQAAILEGERAAWLRRERGMFEAVARPVSGGPFERLYNAGERILGNRARPIDGVLAARPAMREEYLAATAPLVRGLAVLGANGRTLAIWLACLAGHPAWFWAWELAGLTLLAVLLARALRRVEAGLSSPGGG